MFFDKSPTEVMCPVVHHVRRYMMLTCLIAQHLLFLMALTVEELALPFYLL